MEMKEISESGYPALIGAAISAKSCVSVMSGQGQMILRQSLPHITNQGAVHQIQAVKEPIKERTSDQ